MGPDRPGLRPAGLPGPVFNFHDQDRLDDDAVAAAARGLYGAAGTRNKQLLVHTSAAHGTNLLSLGREAGKARAALRRFVTAHLDR